MQKPDLIPVTLITAESTRFALDGDTAMVLLLANTGHGHEDGASCIACQARGDVRALLHDLLEEEKQGLRPAFKRVVIDARSIKDTGPVVAALTGKAPALALRDHTVARRFYLVG
jgi:G3E family GTPase